MEIEPCGDINGMHKTGSLPQSLSIWDIAKVVGLEPNMVDDGKATVEWCFTIDGVKCGIWDYKGNRWSTYGPVFLLDFKTPEQRAIDAWKPGLEYFRNNPRVSRAMLENEDAA